jgi:hypothetical protein
VALVVGAVVVVALLGWLAYAIGNQGNQGDPDGGTAASPKPSGHGNASSADPLPR